MVEPRHHGDHIGCLGAEHVRLIGPAPMPADYTLFDAAGSRLGNLEHYNTKKYIYLSIGNNNKIASTCMMSRCTTLLLKCMPSLFADLDAEDTPPPEG